MKIKLLFLVPLVLGLLSGLAGAEPVSIEQAKGEDLASAIGHFSRARSLLIAAVNEFDLGRKYADPQVLVDVDAWRKALLGRAEDLDHLLAPQPRVTRGGVQYEPDTRLLNEAKH